MWGCVEGFSQVEGRKGGFVEVAQVVEKQGRGCGGGDGEDGGGRVVGC